MDYNEMMKAALLKHESYGGLSDEAKELLDLCAVIDLKNAAEARARLEPYQQDKGFDFDDVALWGTVVLAAQELWHAGFFKKGGIDIDQKLFTGLWSDELKEAALKEAESCQEAGSR